MLAITYHGPKDVRVETVADPTPQDLAAAVVKVKACGICGSDLHIYNGHGFSTDIGFCVGHESMDHGGALPEVVLEAVGLDQTITAGIKLVRPSEN